MHGVVCFLALHLWCLQSSCTTSAACRWGASCESWFDILIHGIQALLHIALLKVNFVNFLTSVMEELSNRTSECTGG